MRRIKQISAAADQASEEVFFLWPGNGPNNGLYAAFLIRKISVHKSP